MQARTVVSIQGENLKGSLFGGGIQHLCKVNLQHTVPVAHITLCRRKWLYGFLT